MGQGLFGTGFPLLYRRYPVIRIFDDRIIIYDPSEAWFIITIIVSMAETDLHIINNEYISCMNTLRKGKKKILRIATTNPNEEELAKDKIF